MPPSDLSQRHPSQTPYTLYSLLRHLLKSTSTTSRRFHHPVPSPISKPCLKTKSHLLMLKSGPSNRWRPCSLEAPFSTSFHAKTNTLFGQTTATSSILFLMQEGGSRGSLNVFRKASLRFGRSMGLTCAFLGKAR